MKNVIFYLGMGVLFTHELDAVAHHEWRILPLTNSLPEDIALSTFVLAHVPLFAIAIAAVASPKGSVRKVDKDPYCWLSGGAWPSSPIFLRPPTLWVLLFYFSFSHIRRRTVGRVIFGIRVLAQGAKCNL